jgi:putative oxidoreductase
VVDPEDDLPTSTYAGDFETTAIPRYDTGSASAEPRAYELLGDPEPLPYVQSGGRNPSGLVEPTEIEADDDTRDRLRLSGRRGTQDLGLMLLRVGLGALLIAHGLHKAFGLWGGGGLATFEQSLVGVGFKHAGLLAYVGVGGQLGIGVLLILGLFTPLAAAGAVAYFIDSLLAAVATQPHSGYFPFFLPDGHEYQVMLVVVAAALTLTGPGLYGFDAGRGWARRPFIGSVVALLVGIGVGVGAWILLNGTNPLA